MKTHLFPTQTAAGRMAGLILGITLTLTSVPDARSADTKSGADAPRPGQANPRYLGIYMPDGAPAPEDFKDLKEYLWLHETLRDPADPEWNGALKKAGESGDGFSLAFLKTLRPERLPSDKDRLLEGAIVKLEARLAGEGSNPPPAVILKQLERAALADVICHSTESTLVKWALDSARAQIHRPEVRNALESTRTNAPPPESRSGLDAMYRVRVAAYAGRLLREKR